VPAPIEISLRLAADQDVAAFWDWFTDTTGHEREEFVFELR
jgi:hypothetical protein